MHAEFTRLLHKFEPQSTLLRAWGLTGGVSAQITALEVQQQGGQTKRLIVRQHGPRDLAQNPRIAADEFRLLSILQSAGLPTPKPYYLDESGDIFPTPYIVVEYIEGQPEFAPADLPDFIRQMAVQLARIHRVDHAAADLSFLPSQTQNVTGRLRQRPPVLDTSLQEDRIRDALDATWPPAQHNASALLHGDYWPGNLLWKDDELIGVIDWEDAASGDPLVDLANTRLEILWAFDSDAMQQFTQHYQAITAVDMTNLPLWDLCAALRPASRIAEWAGDPQREQVMRAAHRVFTQQALASL